MAGTGIFTDGTHHCAMFPVEAQGASHRALQRCKVNPGHKNFLKIDEFRKKDPSEIPLAEEDVPKIWNIIDRTVRIVVAHTSAERPDTYPNSNNPYPCKALRGNNMWIRNGTGFLSGSTFCNGEEPSCYCPACKKSSSTSSCQTTTKRERYYFGISTAAHVIFDTKEAQRAVFELFYDSENRKGIKYLYGLTANGNLQTDRCYVLCLTHDKELSERLEEMCTSEISEGFPCGLLVSHPHGVSKRVSIGRFLHQKFIVIDDSSCIKLKKGMKVRFPGCRDATYLVEAINRRLMDREPVIGLVNHGEHRSLEFLADLKVLYPPNLLIEYSMEGAFAPENISKKDWWRLPPGVELVTDSGNRFPIPRKLDGLYTIQMEVLVKETIFHHNFSKIFGSEATLYTASTYDFASCPGSSGAPVFFRNGHTAPESCVTDAVHFGCLGDRNTTGLDAGWIFQLLHA